MRTGTRRRGLTIAGVGLAIAIAAALWPAAAVRIASPSSKLDAFMPIWEFSEHHVMEVPAPPSQVFAAIHEVRAGEIALFQLLTTIRRGGRRTRASILNAPDDSPILEVATRSGFVWLADDPPRELVVGTVIAAPQSGQRGKPRLGPEEFRRPLPAGFTLATMNFLVTSDPAGGSIVSTETRVHANSAESRRRFAFYWRLIYPGSSLIRVMWLRAIRLRSEGRQKTSGTTVEVRASTQVGTRRAVSAPWRSAVTTHASLLHVSAQVRLENGHSSRSLLFLHHDVLAIRRSLGPGLAFCPSILRKEWPRP